MRKELVELNLGLAFMKKAIAEDDTKEGSNKLKKEINNLLRNLKVILNDGKEEELELLKSFLFDYDAKDEDNTGRYKIPINNLLKSGKTITTKQFKESFVSIGTTPDKIDTGELEQITKDTFDNISKILEEIPIIDTKAADNKYFESARYQVYEFYETFGDDNMKECTGSCYKEITDLIDKVEHSIGKPRFRNNCILLISCIENIKNKLSKFEEEFYKTI